MAGDNKGKEAALVVGAGGVGAIIYALLSKREAPPGETVFHLDDETRQALATIIALLQDSKAYLAQIAAKEIGILANKDAVIIGQKNVTTAGTAEQLPDIPVPDGCQPIILAKPENTEYIYLGTSKVQAEDSSSRFSRLEAGDSFIRQITNLNIFWIDASVSGEGITFIVEQA